MNGRSALLLRNPNSRRGGGDIAAGLAVLRDAGWSVHEEPLGEPERIGEQIGRHRNAIDTVIVGGGDGTLNASLEGILEHGMTMGVLPLGTANDLALTLGIPVDLVAACKAIVEGPTERIDLGRVNGKHYLNVASMGLSVRVAQRLTGAVKQRWGILGYAVTVARVLRQMRSFRARVTCDGVTTDLKSIQLVVGNGRHYGGGMTVRDDAAIDDGRLDVYSLDPVSPMSLLMHLPAMRRGDHHQMDTVQASTGQRVDVETDRPLKINTDGEITTRTPARFEVVPSVLPIIVPPKAKGT